MSGFAAIHNLAEALDIEMLDRDLFRGNGLGAERPFLYGGQVAAQALRAAGLTVPDGRHPHSLHGYFLRSGRADRPVLLKVDRDRDGGSFSSRHVTAVQNGEAIFSMLASFHDDEEGETRDALPQRAMEAPRDTPMWQWDPFIDVEELNPSRFEGERYFLSDHLRVRAAHPLPDDRLMHACAVTYVSDVSTGLGQFEPPLDVPGGPSIDHSLWFHRPARADQWMTMELWPAKVGGQRGLYFGTIRDGAGELLAVLTQEMLLRRSQAWTRAAAERTEAGEPVFPMAAGGEAGQSPQR
jgi:acyl-CoA thioesterase-2